MSRGSSRARDGTHPDPPGSLCHPPDPALVKAHKPTHLVRSCCNTSSTATARTGTRSSKTTTPATRCGTGLLPGRVGADELSRARILWHGWGPISPSIRAAWVQGSRCRPHPSPRRPGPSTPSPHPSPPAPGPIAGRSWGRFRAVMVATGPSARPYVEVLDTAPSWRCGGGTTWGRGSPSNPPGRAPPELIVDVGTRRSAAPSGASSTTSSSSRGCSTG